MSEKVKKTKVPGGQVVGIRHYYGSIEGSVFDVYHLFISTPSVDKDGFQEFGVCPSFVKCKASILHQIVSPDKINKLLDRHVSFLYDSFDNVAVVNLDDKS